MSGVLATGHYYRDRESSAGVVPAVDLEQFIQESRYKPAFKSSGRYSPYISSSTLYYDGTDFKQAGKVETDAATGDVFATFDHAWDTDAVAALISKSGETKITGERALISKDKNDNVISAKTKDGKRIYSVERDQGGIKRFIEYGSNGKPSRILERLGNEINPAWDALVSRLPFRNMDTPPANLPNPKEIPHSFNWFHEIEPETGKASFFPQRLNINITADGIVRYETAGWDYLFSSSTDIIYCDPNKNFTSAFKTHNERVIQYAGGVEEHLDKKTGKSVVNWQTVDGKEHSLTDVTLVNKKNGDLVIFAPGKLITFTADGRYRVDESSGMPKRWFDRNTDEIVRLDKLEE